MKTGTKIILLLVVLVLVGAAATLLFFTNNDIQAGLFDGPSTSGTPDPTPSPTPTPDPLQMKLTQSMEDYQKGLALFEQQKYAEAIPYFEAVIPGDPNNYSLALEKLQACWDVLTAPYTEEGRALIDKTFYLEAQKILEEGLEKYPKSVSLKKLKDEAHTLATTLVKYEGPTYHVFFHSLIVYPELCFTGDSMERGYNDWMTTVREFKLMLSQMHERGYTLIALGDMFSTDSSGKVVANDILLPKGKKPLVISVDDVSYYKYMEKDGFAKRLVFDEKGDVATLVKTPQGDEIVTRDGDVVPILDDFIKEHPDFSYTGAKGTLALTGYEGILGYNTLHNNPDWEKEQAKVQPVVDKLKATGWSFANHSFTHRRSYTEGTLTMDYLKYDMKRWLDEVGGIVGETNLYISPFGAYFGQNDPRHQYIVSQGFTVYCGVGSRAYYNIYGNNVYMERINLDGFKMFHSPKVLSDLIDVKEVFDPVRPPMK